MLTVRPIEQWTEILGKLPSPEGQNSERLVADRIIGDLVGYRHSSKQRQRDAAEIANAMQAYARMMFDAGVRP